MSRMIQVQYVRILETEYVSGCSNNVHSLFKSFLKLLTATLYFILESLAHNLVYAQTGRKPTQSCNSRCDEFWV